MLTSALLLLLSTHASQVALPPTESMPPPLVDGTPEPPPAPGGDGSVPPANWRGDLAFEPEGRSLFAVAPAAALLGTHLAFVTVFTGVVMGITALPLLFIPFMLTGDPIKDGNTYLLGAAWLATMPFLWLPVLVGEHLLSGLALGLAPVASALTFRMVTGSHRFPRLAFLGGSICFGLAALTLFHGLSWTLTALLSLGMLVVGGSVAMMSTTMGTNARAASLLGNLTMFASPLPLFALPALAFTALLSAAAVELGVAAVIAAWKDPVPL